jgi:DNA (cytosine-5)-methyltransferase 1
MEGKTKHDSATLGETSSRNGAGTGSQAQAVARGAVRTKQFTVLDLFSGVGGMSYGFAARPEFQIMGAIDAEQGKPSSQSLDCNAVYETNLGLRPDSFDLLTYRPASYRKLLERRYGRRIGVDVLIACAPCTGFSQMIAANAKEDHAKNCLVRRCAGWVNEFKPQVFVMENLPEMLSGKFAHHFEYLARKLSRLGYRISKETVDFSTLGLPQKRRRAVIICVRGSLRPLGLDAFWSDKAVRHKAITVRSAFSGIEVSNGDDPASKSPLNTEQVLNLIRAIPRDGGSWTDLISTNDEALLIPCMVRRLMQADLSSFSDVYGRLTWDKPAPTIKRESCHLGNGRYAHPEQDRLISVREAACLQGFPRDYELCCRSLSHSYRHIGDAVPPLVSYQIAGIVKWILTKEAPTAETMVLPNTNLSVGDITAKEEDTPEEAVSEGSRELLRKMRMALTRFFRKHGRDLPWRKRRFGHFKTLVVECLLQKTVASAVLPILARFLKLFGTVGKLADASEEAVQSAMASLGLPARAPQMIRMAQKIRARHEGKVPWTFRDLVGLPGVGVYTACAVRSFSFGIPEGIVDANVIRVLERFFGESTPGKWFRQRASHWLPFSRRLSRSSVHREVNYALLDLGATICRPRAPSCNECPLKELCVTGRKNTER